jgi:inhibitor of KinA sporulation pathway (predicted exonuclease)
MAPKLHILVVDLEATCTDCDEFPRTEMETIEIGAVLIDGYTFAPIAEHQTFIRPILHPTLTEFCTRLTTITQADVDPAPSFPTAMATLSAWLSTHLGGDRAAFASWGGYDWNQLTRDAALHRIALPRFVLQHNIKQRFAQAEHGRPRGMAGALRRAGLPLDGTHHRGIDDARNIARLVPYALEKRGLPVR